MPKIFALTHCDASGTLLVVSADSSSMWHCGYDYTVRDATVEFPVGFSTQQDTFMVRGTYDCLPSAMRGLQLELRDLLHQVEKNRAKTHEQLLAVGAHNCRGDKKVLGVDYHGVISEADPQLAAAMACAVEEGHHVCIMTGSRMTPELREELGRCGFEEGKSYTDFFSIQDHLDSVGETITYDERGMPHADPLAWDMAKSEYALATGMSAIWDDSPTYCRYMPASCWYFTYSPDKVCEQVRMVLDGTRKRIGR